MRIARHSITLCVPLVIAASLAFDAVAQTAVRPEFEVASLKLNTDCGNRRGGGLSPGRLTLACANLRNLIRVAYGTFADGPKINPRQLEVLGGPAWLDSESYDLNAKAADAGAAIDQMSGPMLQRLLEDRCKLKVHRETRDVPVYSLTVLKSGAKIQASKEGSCIPLDINHLPARAEPGQPQPNICGGMSMRSNGVSLTADAHGQTMAEFAGRMLAGSVDRPVIDKTGLAGVFDIHLEYVRDMGAAGPMRLNGVDTPGGAAVALDVGGPSIFTAIQEQLGLKLSPDKCAVEVIVVDSVEKPSEN